MKREETDFGKLSEQARERIKARVGDDILSALEPHIAKHGRVMAMATLAEAIGVMVHDDCLENVGPANKPGSDQASAAVVMPLASNIIQSVVHGFTRRLNHQAEKVH